MRAGAFAAIFDERRHVLLCHRRDIDAWNLPGSGVEAGEAPWDAAVREVREEVGLEVEIARLTGLCDVADAVGYFSVDALPPNTGRKQVERIRDALVDGPAVLRTQTGPSMRDLFDARKPT